MKRFVSVKTFGFALLLGALVHVHAATYRLLVVYTPAAESAILAYSGYHSTALTDYISEYAVDLTNEIYLNSPAGGLAMPRVELAGIVKANYTETNVMENDLANLRSGQGAFSNIPGLRDLYAADVVLLVTNRSSHSGTIIIPEGSTGPVGSDYAFALARWDRVRLTYTAAHELGHVFGCAHNEELSHGYSPFPYSHGHIYMTQDGVWWGDVMSGGLPSLQNDRRRWFSNPNLTYLGTPRGDHQTANCTRVHNERRHAVASFRTPQQYALVMNKTVKAHEYADVVGETIFTLSGVTIASGGEASLRATSTITMYGGFKVEPGGYVSLRVDGPGSLSKPGFEGTGEAARTVPEPAVPSSVSLRVTPGAGTLSLQYGLPEAVPVSYRILNLRGQVVSRAMLGHRSAGGHVETVRFDGQRGSYILELRAGTSVRTQRFALVQ